MSATRRQVLGGLLTGTGAVGAGIALTGAVTELLTGPAARLAGGRTGHGPLVPDPGGLLDLPAGFRYRVLSRQGEPMLSGQGPVPGHHDGMAALPGACPGRLWLVRNHENKPDDTPVPVPAVRGLVYDPGAAGGCTVLELARDRTPPGAPPAERVLSERVGLAGTAVNCAGGPTPWGSWLTCEENEDRAGTNGYERDHGFVFEVDPGPGRRTVPEPLTALGRFQHEAVAVDPRTGAVYETEDAFDPPFGLFYRFLPRRPLGGFGSLRAGGELQALRVRGVPDLSAVREPGTVLEHVEWVPVPDPPARRTPVRLQDFGRAGITRGQKLEGCYWAGSSVYFVSSYARALEGSAADHSGQVWRYDPARRRLTLVAVFGPDTGTGLPGESPDNICLAPGGGLLVCEDGGGAQYVHGLTRHGRVYPVARNAQNTGTPERPEYGEFAGVTFAPDGRTMYVNCYEPGTTFAVTGPWRH
ncbi:alkaline phosphatase PhoX [Streptomyces sp. TRM 70361]|uniref:alkaline phosphatase PhoX n=1 Tax=Streptomyces sp. TRM 70361 TaxID=3116553 RepID=UPI002E7B977A|nr:alkaline phosphatase PhoX [Streptomyces sp. TRM 70361]MEE1941103.1 alkaline phosphatase PhoX [Streptomyces sp. TRM 70361]